MKKLIINCWCMVTLLVLFASLVTATESVKNYDEACAGETCTLTVYSYPKYYQINGEWMLLNESFDTTNCAQGFTYCVDNNLFQFHAPEQLGSFQLTTGEHIISFTPQGVTTLVPQPFLSTTAQLADNIITYLDVIPSILDIRYGYTWQGVKEELIFKQNPVTTLLTGDVVFNFTLSSNLPPTVNEAGITFTNANVPVFTLEGLYAIDATQRITPLSFIYQDSTFQLHIPVSFLENASYPVIIDPSITFTNESISNNGFIFFDGINNKYTRYAASSTLPIQVGDFTGGEDAYLDYRGVIEWTLKGLPTLQDIEDINLTLYFEIAADQQNENLSFKSMDGNWTTYPDTPTGNQDYYTDMANGTLLENQIVNAIGSRSFNLSVFDSGLDLEQKSLNQSWWGIGIHTNPIDPGSTPQAISPAGTLNATQRPILIITYRYANEEEGDTAIEQAILNVLPTADIHNEQQVYTRNSEDRQELGRFDKFAISGSQRWGINYVTDGESFTEMGNLSNRFYVLEMTNKTTSQITSEVEAFISGTIV